MKYRRTACLMLALFVLIAGAGYAQDDIVIDFYFPSATANDAEGIFQRYADMFQEDYPGITINSVFSGSYSTLR